MTGAARYLHHARRVVEGRGDPAREHELARRAWRRLDAAGQRAAIVAYARMMAERGDDLAARAAGSAGARRESLLAQLARVALEPAGGRARAVRKR